VLGFPYVVVLEADLGDGHNLLSGRLESRPNLTHTVIVVHGKGSPFGALWIEIWIWFLAFSFVTQLQQQRVYIASIGNRRRVRDTYWGLQMTAGVGPRLWRWARRREWVICCDVLLGYRAGASEGERL
jgi:hypothetical protein